MSEKGLRPGWYPDPDGMADTQRYWDGQNWTDDVAPMRRSRERRGMSAGTALVVIVVGILLSAGIIFAIYKANQPSDADCAIQRLEYVQGKRSAYEVDDACKD